MKTKPLPTLRPLNSLNHNLNELAVNRRTSCDVVRELVDNAWEAQASQVLVFPYLQRRGLVVFDNGTGLSINPEDGVQGVHPYQAFFSLGFSNKPDRDGVPRSGMGAKRAFGTTRLTVITRTKGESAWRIKIINRPLETIDKDYSLQAQRTGEPWKVLEDRVITHPDWSAEPILQTFSQEFFVSHFQTGTLIVTEGIIDDDYARHYQAYSSSCYLPVYIRTQTAHKQARKTPKRSPASSIGCSAVKPRPWNVKVLAFPGINNLRISPYTWTILNVPYRFGSGRPSANA